MAVTAVGHLVVYPIKSLDGLSVRQAVVLPSGALQHDREFALFDGDGKWINGKRDRRVHLVRSEYNLSNFTVSLSGPHIPAATFHLLDDRRMLEEWFSDFFQFEVDVRKNVEMGFPDDTASPGPTIVSAATLAEVGSWFNMTDAQEIRRRFRANIELTADAAFWEDRLFGDEGQVVSLSIGDVVIHGVNPCQRCVVPSRNSATGTVTEDFQRIFTAMRGATLPQWAAASRFNHYYRLSVNTKIPRSEAGKILHVGDSVRSW